MRLAAAEVRHSLGPLLWSVARGMFDTLDGATSRAQAMDRFY
jgi:hypothetical protein